MSPTAFPKSSAIKSPPPSLTSIQPVSTTVSQTEVTVTDQYADGAAAKNWLLYIGEQAERTNNYKDFLVKLLEEKEAVTILDAACGTGVDSVMLIEEMGSNPGFSLTSSDYSYQMLKQAYKTRWDRRKEPAFFNWIIEEGNWLTLTKDVKTTGAGYDAIICMGNSFPHLLDDDGDLRNQKRCIQNFHDLLKPGGTLVIDHRNFDYILKHGRAPKNNIYYSSEHVQNIATKIIYENNEAKEIVLNYKMSEGADFSLSYQPYTLPGFSNLLTSVFGTSTNYTRYADFKPLSQEAETAFYVHVIEKAGRKW